MWNQLQNQKCVLKPESTVEVPVVKTNGNLTLVGKL